MRPRSEFNELLMFIPDEGIDATILLKNMVAHRMRTNNGLYEEYHETRHVQGLMQLAMEQDVAHLGKHLKIFKGPLHTKQTLKSQEDASINVVERQLTGFIESRYVRRSEDYFIAYVSSQTGCNHMCKMCHLTQTGQRQFTQCTKEDFEGQIKNVLAHYKQDKPAKYCHVNFMARGEPLSNPIVNDELLNNIRSVIRSHGYSLPIKFNISTIIPKNTKSLVDRFKDTLPTIYYSMYAVDRDFRDKWLPSAMHHYEALDLLKEYQTFSKKIVKFHCAFIKGENDLDYHVTRMLDAIQFKKITAEFNIVRYNPFSPEQGEETGQEDLENIMKMINAYGIPCKIIPRVGTDVYASCGTFAR